MIKCSKCGRENDDSFKFCLDCGAELRPTQDAAPPAAPAAAIPAAPAVKPATGAVRKSPSTTSAPAAASVAPEAAPPPAAPTPAKAAPTAADGIRCPKCSAVSAPGSTFCSSCGQRMGEEAPKGRTMFMHTASPEAAKKPKVRLVLIKPDGTEGTVFTLAAEKTVLGRTQGIIMFPKDPYISPKHAELLFKDGALAVVDLGSLNGVYYRMKQETQIFPGTYFRIGRQLLRLEVPGDFQAIDAKTPPGDDSQFWGSPAPQVWARLVQVLEGGKIGEIHLLTQAENLIGREEGEVRFPEDGFISSRHCMLINKEGVCFLRDLGSSNGTYLRIRESQELASDDRIQIGNQVLKVDMT